ncbi:uncharacterized protein [Atheta coriaria]|uniref:uncharacterized protein isoform X2 n=1 Tax=Dalotia coriaria TaxID=877792 RepID=UPI0031F37D02
MLLTFFIILAFCGRFAIGAEIKKHVQNSVYPYDLDPPSYNIESWVKQLHLQQCALVEVGDKYYAIFVESRPRRYDQEKGIKEYFLGLCDDDTLNKWSFCAASLQRKRADDCNFYTKNMYNTRVHRRLCDLTLLALNAPQCDCSNDLSDSKLYKVQGFPTCFKPPLPSSLCGDNNVCGLAGCSPRTINKRVHSMKCDRKCNENQPFCEPCDKKSSLPRQIRSFWTDWSNPYCTDSSCISQFDEAICINRETGRGDIDCLGPGTSCCTPELQNCKCHVYEEGGATKVFRTFSIPQPEMAEYMSEEDFINSIPLRYLKEEFHKYPGYSPRTFGNINHARERKALKKFKTAVLKAYLCDRKHHTTVTPSAIEEPTTYFISTAASTSSIATQDHTSTASTKTDNNDYNNHHTTTSGNANEITKLHGDNTNIAATNAIANDYIHHDATTSAIGNGITKAHEDHVNTPSGISDNLDYDHHDTSTSGIANGITKSHDDHSNIANTGNSHDKVTVPEKEVSILHEVNDNPLDTFSSKPILEPGECIPCKRYLNKPRPHVNTNGIHHKSRIHQKPCKFEHNHFLDFMRRRSRKERDLIRARRLRALLNHVPIYSKVKSKLKPFHTRSALKHNTPLKKIFNNKNLVQYNPKPPEDEEKDPLDMDQDDPDIFIKGIDNKTLDTKRSANMESTLKKKLSFDLIFDDTKIPHDDYSRDPPGDYYRIPVKRHYANNKKNTFKIGPRRYIHFKKYKETEDMDPHLEKHFYARPRTNIRPSEPIPQFGDVVTKVTTESTTTIRKQTLHAEMDDEDFITDENGLLWSEKKDDDNKVKESSAEAFLYNFNDIEKFHLKREEDKMEPAITLMKFYSTNAEDSNLEDTQYLGTTVVTAADNGCTDHILENVHTVREDDNEDAMELEDRLDIDLDGPNSDEIISRKKIVNDFVNVENSNKNHLNCLSLLETKSKNPRYINHNYFEDEDERLRLIQTPNSIDMQNKLPDVFEDEDLSKPVTEKKTVPNTSTECEVEPVNTEDQLEETPAKLRPDMPRKRFAKVTSEEISDDDGDTEYDDDDDVALEYDEDEKEEKVTTTERTLERGEDKSVNVKVESEQVDAMSRSEANSSSDNSKDEMSGKSNSNSFIFNNVYLDLLGFIFVLLY